MNKVTQRLQRDFQDTVKTWNNQPVFTRTVSSSTNKIVGEVYTSNKIYGYVNNGTKAHFIAPKNVRALRFRSRYTAKTSPGRIFAKNGGASGNFVFSKGHMVKGIQARKFDKQIADFEQDKVVDIFTESLDELLEV